MYVNGFYVVLVELKVRRIWSTYRLKFIIMSFLAMCEACGYCEKISGMMPDEGAPIASPCFWRFILRLLVK